MSIYSVLKDSALSAVLALFVVCAAAALLAYGVFRGKKEFGPAEVLVWETHPISDVQRENEWRKGRAVPPGTYRILEERVPEAGVLRLSLAPRGLSTEPIVVRIGGDGRVDERFEVTRHDGWTDRRIDVSRHAGEILRVEVASPVYWLVETCELLPREADRPNVLVFLVDTLRADHLGAFGYERDTSPRFDALAAEGLRFTQAISQSSWTRPAVASLLTGVYPPVHQARDRGDKVRSDLPTLAGALRDAGYETQAIMSNPTCLPTWGFGKGFSRFVDVDSYEVESDKDARVVDAALEALDDLAGRPWFLYVHAMGPHNPYEPPAPYDRRFRSAVRDAGGEAAERARLMDLYDGEIAYTDAQFGRLVDALKDQGLYDNTLIVMLSDHGEAFWEHGVNGHGLDLHDEQIRIPLVVKLPGGGKAGEVRSDLAEIVDVAPTVLEVLDVPAPPSFQGRSLLRAADGPNRAAYSSLFLEMSSAVAARTATAKFIEDATGGGRQWFDLASDPGETRPLLEPPAGSDFLERHAEAILSTAGHGLHLLFTGSLLEDHTFTGTVEGAIVGDVRLRYLARNGEVQRTPEGVTFRIRTQLGSDVPGGLVEWHEEGAEQNNARLSLDVDPDRPVRISVQLDGEPVPVSSAYVGADMTNRPLDGAEFMPRDLRAPPQAFFVSALPRRLAVYVWYVEKPSVVADEDLDPGMAEALEALGYL